MFQVNDLAKENKQANLGVWNGNINLNILLYADYIALMAENESNLQNMMNIVYMWCSKWRLAIERKHRLYKNRTAK